MKKFGLDLIGCLMRYTLITTKKGSYCIRISSLTRYEKGSEPESPLSEITSYHPPPDLHSEPEPPLSEISSPKASNGQRFPCPALLLSISFYGGSRAAAPIGDEVQ